MTDIMKWQPIETAPKDGTSILVGCDYDRRSKSRVALVWWDDAVSAGIWGNWIEAKWFDEHVECDFVPMHCEFKPTHWMPLPPAPDAT